MGNEFERPITLGRGGWRVALIGSGWRVALIGSVGWSVVMGVLCVLVGLTLVEPPLVVPPLVCLPLLDVPLLCFCVQVDLGGWCLFLSDIGRG